MSGNGLMPAAVAGLMMGWLHDGADVAWDSAGVTTGESLLVTGASTRCGALVPAAVLMSGYCLSSTLFI